MIFEYYGLHVKQSKANPFNEMERMTFQVSVHVYPIKAKFVYFLIIERIL